MKRLCCFLLVCYALIFETYAQQYNFTNYTINEGLSQSVVNCIFQDSKGFIWLGTQNGLNRFDGEDFEVYRFNPANPNSISNNWVFAISEDKEGNLWLGTKGGLNKYLRTENYFIHYNYETSFAYDVTQHIYDNICLKNGKLVLNTPPVLTVFNPESGDFTHFQNSAKYDRTVEDTQIPILEDDDGNVWVGSKKGLAYFSFETQKFTTQKFIDSTGHEQEEVSVTALYKNKTSGFWVGTTTGLYCLNISNNTFEEAVFPRDDGGKWSFATNCVRAILQDKAGSLFVGTEGNGMFVLTQNNEGYFSVTNYDSNNSTIAHNIVHDLIIDKSNNLWLGTLSGVSKADLKKNKFQLYRNTNGPNSINLLGNVIAGMLKNDDGILWVGNWGQGLNLVNMTTNEVEHFSSHETGNHYIPNDFVHVIYRDSDQNMWIGTRNGIYIHDESKNQFMDWRTYFRNPELPALNDTRIYQIIQSRTHDYWIASANGLFKINLNDGTTEVFQAELEEKHRISANSVYSVLEDSDGLIWIATIQGLDLYDPKTKSLKHFKKGEKGLSSDFVISMCEDAKGQVWIGTNSYLNVYNRKESTFTYFTEEDGLPSNYIYEIAMDKNKDLWFATGGGLAKFDQQTHLFQAFSIEDGLQSLEFNLRASCTCENGQMLFGGMNGFNAFNPDSIAGNPFVPNVVITSFTKTKGNKQERINWDGEDGVVLKQKESYFNIEFAALEYTNPRANKYEYKMEGISDDWINIGNRKFVPFFALPAGEYIFRVKGSNNDGVWSTNDASIRIVVLPPWWRSKAAYLAYFILLALAIVAFVKLRERKFKNDNILLEKKVQGRTLLVKEQNRIITSKNEELNGLNRTKDKFFSIIGHDLGNHFNIIIGFTEVLLSGFRKMDEEKQAYHLSNIHNSSVRAHNLLGNLLTWSRLQRNAIVFNPRKQNVNVKIRSLLPFHEEAAFKKNILIEVFSKENLFIEADENMFSTIIRNLLGNAIKFTPSDGEISIRIKRVNLFCEISINDSGIGILDENREKIFRVDSTISTKGTDGEKGTGLGLVLCNEFVEKHGGKIWVESKVGKGSSFIFQIPLSNNE